MLPSAFQGGRVQASPIECNRVTQEQANETRPTRKVTFQDSYEELTPSTSNPQPARNEPSRLIGFQKDPKLHERQKEEQREERKASNAPIDLRDKLNATKRAREQDGQTSSNRGTPAPSPSQPEARRQRVTRELLTTAEMKQLDVTARDALRPLQCICKLFLSVLRKSGHEISETETRALNSFPFDVDCLSFL